MMALSVVMFYMVIGVFEPSIEQARNGVRFLFLFNGGASIYLISRYLLSMRQKGKHER